MNDSSSNPFAVGALVLIRFNPHHSEADNIAGVVTQFQSGAAFNGYDMAQVRYTLPKDGSVQEMPFGTSNLEPVDAAALIALAEMHEAQAVEMRRLAGEIGS